MKEKLTVWFLIILFYIFRIFKIQANKIVFSSMDGRYGDNGKYITSELIKHKEKYDIVWIAKENTFDEFPEGVRLISNRAIKRIFELATAKIWVDNARKPAYVRKRRDQYYINTGHGGIPLKKIEKDASENLPDWYIKTAIHDSSMTDLMTSNSAFRTLLLRNSYWYNGEVMECGQPKIEQLLIATPNLKKNICRIYGIKETVKIALFAPTFRDDHNFDYQFDFNLVVNKLTDRFKGEWVILKRMHPGITDVNFKSQDDIIDVTSYPDMQDLLKISDVLFTDYSGTMFETLYDENKVTFLYARDRGEYNRGFYFNIEELPFTFSNTMKELGDAISNFDKVIYINEVHAFKKKVGLIETLGAAKAIVKRIDSVIFESREQKINF